MPEILTESFCERCGTRYTFESTAPRKTRRLGQFKTLSKGMKNWVMSDDTSLDEAMAAARSDDDRALTSHQLDAFHATFNFCMTCRQYTCGNCWNTAEGRCLTCAPHLGHEILPAPFPDQVAFEPIRIEAEAWPEVDLSAPSAGASNGNGHDLGIQPGALDPWASAGATDVEEMPDFDPAARLAFLSGETPVPVVEPEPELPAASVETAEEAEAQAASAWPVPDEPSAATASEDLAPAATAETIPAAPVAASSSDEIEIDAAVVGEMPGDAPAAEDDAIAPPPAIVAPPVAEPLPATAEGKAGVGTARTTDLLRRFRPGQNIDAELAAFEAEQTDVPSEAAAVSEPVVGAAAEPVAASDVDSPPETIATDTPHAVAAPVAHTPAPLPSLTWRTSPTPALPAEPLAAATEPATTPTEPATAEPAAAAAAEPLAASAVPEPAGAVAEAPVAPAELAEPEAPAELAAAQVAPTAPEPVAPAAPVPAPIAAEPPRDDRIQQPTWQIYAPDATPAVDRPLEGPVSPPAPAQPPAAFAADPQWPVRPDLTDSPAMALLANGASRSSDGLWAASAQEVLAPPANASATAPAGVQPCSSCGLSLSATARFCRRCGTRQG